ncbi:hypothetical protein N7513_010437 [Penicillium frequentans]|nr:hypothetical protein N7513_010437 [Penicillium glabrum]
MSSSKRKADEITEEMTDSPHFTPGNFLTSVLPLYRGPLVQIQIESSGKQYEVLKGLLCKKSTYFAAMFDEQEKISDILEFVRFADMIHLTGMENKMSNLIKDTLSEYADLGEDYYDLLLHEHLESVCCLPTLHPVRCIMVRGLVPTFLKDFPFKYASVLVKYPQFALDLLYEVQSALRGVDVPYNGANYYNLITERTEKLFEFGAQD